MELSKKLLVLNKEKLLYWKYAKYDIKKKKNILIQIGGLINDVIRKKIKIAEFEHHESATILFCKTVDDRNRRDTLSSFRNVVNETDLQKRDYIWWNEQDLKSRIFNLKRAIRNLIFLITKNYYVSGYTLNEKISDIRDNIQFLDYQDDIIKYTAIGNYKLCVVLYDSFPIDNFVVQLFRSYGVKTATLQHGVFDIRGKQIWADNSIADFFLTWNDFTRKVAIDAGIEESRLVICGNFKCVGRAKIQRKENRIIGVILDDTAGVFADENPKMIKIVDEFCDCNGYKYILRFHPLRDTKMYNNLINSSIGDVCSPGISLEEFLSDVEFCVVSSSTVLCEIESYGLPFFHYVHHSYNIYNGYTNYNFQTLDELQKLYDNNYHDIKSLKSSQYHYKEFFEKFY